MNGDMMAARLLLAVAFAAASMAMASSAIDDALSYKSLVLGSLASGQVASGRVSSSSCHNYYMNVTEIGYSLVVDLNTSSTALYLLVKASPILRHSLEDEHNYANYYQFKKQGGHHGVVVTSEHLSPGRWYIGVCNYVPDPPSFDDKKRGKGSGSANTAIDYAEYTFTPTLNRSMASSDSCGPECQKKETAARMQLHERMAPELRRDHEDGSCGSKPFRGLSVDVPVGQSQTSEFRRNEAEHVKQMYGMDSRFVGSGRTGAGASYELLSADDEDEVEMLGRQDVPAESAGLPLCKNKKDSCTLVHSAWATWTFALVLGAMWLLHQGRRERSLICEEKARNPSPAGPSSSNERKSERDAAILKQLADARNACQALEEELAAERRSISGGKSNGSGEALDGVIKDLTERLLSERERVSGFQGESAKWRSIAEDAQRCLSRVQRERDEAFRARDEALRSAEMMDAERHTALRGVALMQMDRGHKMDVESLACGLGSSSVDLRKAKGRSAGRLGVVGSGASSPMRGDSSSNILAHSKSFTFGGSPVLGTPMRALTSYDNISEDLFLSSGDLPKSGDAFAAFMGVESDQSAELFGELEPRNEGASHRREDYQSPAETRARGKRGGQRRKRAAGDVVGHGLQHNFENEATDCLATSMALAALSCMDEGDFE